MNPESPQGNPADHIPGIGINRGKILSRLGIHTIAHFLKKTSTDDGLYEISRELKISERMMLRLRQNAQDIVRSTSPPLRSGFNLRSVFALLIMGLGVLCIAGGAAIIGMSFHESRFLDFQVILIENDEIEEPSFWWVILVESKLQSSGMTCTKIVIEPDFRQGFSSDFPESIPDGLFLPYLPTGTEIKSVSAKLSFIETETQVVEGHWVKTVDLNEHEIKIPATVENVSDLENYPGHNLIVQLNSHDIPEDLENGQVVDFNLEIQLEDRGYKNLRNQFTDGLISVHSYLSASEQRLLEMNGEIIGTLELPGSFIKLEKNPDRVQSIEYTWRPELSGEFLSPDDMIGAKQFWENGQYRVEGYFVFKVSGSSWFAYVAAIVGFPSIMGGFILLRKRHSRPK